MLDDSYKHRRNVLAPHGIVDLASSAEYLSARKILEDQKTEVQKESSKQGMFFKLSLNRMLPIPMRHFRILDLGARDMRDNRICL